MSAPPNCPREHYTREDWLSYRIVKALITSHRDIENEPAVEVWGTVRREVCAWMTEHGIELGLRPEEKSTKRAATLGDLYATYARGGRQGPHEIVRFESWRHLLVWMWGKRIPFAQFHLPDGPIDSSVWRQPPDEGADCSKVVSRLQEHLKTKLI